MARRWIQEERDFVEEKWGLWTVSRIAKALNRTDYAIIRFAEKNKLGSMYKDMYLTTEQIGKMFRVDSTTVNRYWIQKYGLKAVKMALKERRYWRVKPEDLYEWCKNNQDKWKASHLEKYALGYEEEWLEEKRKKDSDILIKKQGSQWTTKELIKLQELIDEGKSSREISEILNRSFYSVRRQRQRRLHNKEKMVG